MSDVTNQLTVESVNQMLAELQQAARDGQLIQNGYAPTEEEGRATVADGETFKVQGDGDIAAFLYRRIDAETPGELIATFPSQLAVVGDASLSPGFVDGEQVIHMSKDVATGRIVELFGANGGHWRVGLDGEVRRVNADWISRTAAMSPGVVDGEPIVSFEQDQDGAVTAATGCFGGHFVVSQRRLVRANSGAFAAAPKQLNYIGQEYVIGMPELLNMPASSGVAYIFVGMGQSNMAGDSSNANDSLVSAQPVYPENALMLAGGPRQRAVKSGAALVPLVENVSLATNERESPISGWVNHFIKYQEDAFGQRPTVVGINVATGGRPYIGNNRGSLSYSNYEKGLAQAVEGLRARGFSSFVTVIAWVGSESDLTDQMTISRFKGQMRQMRRNASETAKKITGSVSDPVVVLIQPSNIYWDKWFQPVRQAMVELSFEDGFCLAGPAFMFAMTGADYYPDNAIHRSCLGQYTVGQQLARATLAEVTGSTWHGPRPISAHWISSTQIEIECDVMGDALVIDQGATISTVGLENEGFQFDDWSGAPPVISGVAVAGRKITISLDRAPTGKSCRVGYAIQPNANAAGRDGPEFGARGRIRDNAGAARINDGSLHFNWLPGFVIEIN